MVSYTSSDASIKKFITMVQGLKSFEGWPNVRTFKTRAVSCTL